MVSVRTIERRTPWGWETLLVVNGVVGRAEELLCLEERPAPSQRPTLWFVEVTPGTPRHNWMRDRFIRATDQTAESASFVES